MPLSTTSFLFPDINVWLAFASQRHVHHSAAVGWYDSTSPDSHIFFCRFTQMAFLRLITNVAVMGDDVRSREQAWTDYDGIVNSDERIAFVDEPPHIERIFRSVSRQKSPAPKTWTDSYLIAFAEASSLSLVTFDGALASRAPSSQLLRAQ
jgi:toxin-antitoxin system PIN domain toxin